LRILKSETIPSDSPVIFSNGGFYAISQDYFKGCLNYPYVKEAFEYAIKPTNDSELYSSATPFKYLILKDETKIRGLSLLHPRSQILYCDFFEKHTASVLYYCSRSNFSLRKPSRVASYYKPKIDDNSNSLGVSSFFSIEGIDRVHKFYESKDFAILESKFSVFTTADVANCFNSIYTHTIPWATHGKEYNKKYINHKSLFANSFDQRMQRSNNNETNGVPIGNEISRIFSEILFQKIDLNIEEILLEYELVWGKHYQIYRYVDDYFIFSVNRDIMTRCLGALTQCLHEFNFALNQSKTQTLERPFSSKIACTAVETKELLGDFDKSMFDLVKNSEGDSYLLIRKVFKPLGMVNRFISKVRSICLSNEGSYKNISSLIIGSIKRKVALLERGLDMSEEKPNPINNLIVLIEIAFFFYNANPQSSTSRTLCGIILKCNEVVEKYAPEDLSFYRSVVIEKINLIFGGITSAEIESNNQDFLPFEKLNILLSTHDFKFGEKFTEEQIFRLIDGKHLNYFDLISLLFYTKGKSEYSLLIKFLEVEALKISKRTIDIKKCSEKCHLVLDLLSCPFVSKSTKLKLFRNFPFYNRISDDPVRREQAVAEFASVTWFVDWSNFDLGEIIMNKELIRGY
ncbi:antiviral reverse transcriptase Drt3b, partial [Aliiglaciecola sp. NS0011-25]|uniref:antiviral reverse transcriptase Drt3b n=1 Tax=Aliiglaciecola sp. NS0011-25 TaxID=3127654 RepID=UPI00333EF173